MRRFGVLFCFAALMGLGASEASAQQAMEDVVYLKDGSILRGTIIEMTPGKTLKIQTRDGNILTYDMDKVARMTREPAVGGQKSPVYKKIPALSFALSFFVPGTGQFYNGQPGKGAIQLGVAAFGLALLLVETQAGVLMAVTGTGEGGSFNGAWIYFGAWLWSVIDAPISANRINREAQSAHLFQMDAGPFIVGADPVVRRNGMGGALTLRF